MRKTLLLLVVSCTFITSAFSQITKGSLLLGGDLSAFSNKQEFVPNENKNSGITFSPLIGKAVKDNLIIGGLLRIGYLKNENTSNSSSSTVTGNNYGAGVFVRKYKNFKNNFYGFLQGNLEYGFEKTESKQTNILTGENKGNRIGLNLSPGLSYKISEKLHIEAGLREIAAINYQKQTNKTFNQGNTSKSESNSISFNTSLNNFTSSLFFGFRFLLAKK
jgi:hypothetical protein